MKKVTRNNYKVSKGTTIKGKSLTKQDESLTIAQLLAKHIQGGRIDEFRGVFTDDPDHDDIDGEKFFNAMDPADQEDIREGIRAMRARLEALESELTEQEKERIKVAKTAEKHGKEERLQEGQ